MKTTAYLNKDKSSSVEAIEKTKTVTFDTAQLIKFEQPNSKETGVGFDETENPTVALAAKPPS